MKSNSFVSLVSILAICFVGSTVMFAQETDFFWSFQGLNGGAINGPAVDTFNVGDSVSLYLYYTTNGPADSDVRTGAMLDISTSTNDVIRFAGAETLDFDVTIQDVAVGARWGTSLGAAGETGTVTDELINELGAFVVVEYGMREANNGSGLFTDSGYDAGADAFLFGRVDFEVISDLHGSTDIMASTGRGLVVDGNDCNAQVVDVTFGSATIQVVDSILLGDVNLDGAVNLLDVAAFLAVDQYQAEADINQDGSNNLLDVAGFIALLMGDQTPANPPVQPVDGLLGDMNCDGFINLLDPPCVIEFITDGICDFNTADVNQDGTINLQDAEALIKLILALE